MGREYVDFHLSKFDSKVAETLVSLGFKHACTTDYSNLGQVSGLSVYRKAVLEARSRTEILQRLRALANNVLAAVKPLTREALIVAARDKRVATVVVHGEIAELDRHVVEVLDNHLEITMAEVVEAFSDLRRWRNLQSLCRNAAKFELPMVISSGAMSAEEVMPPTQLAYVVSALKDEPTPDLEAISTVPLKLLREKLER
ncbi:MAG: hypothetical protein QW614_04070 [Candidatus Caldarchaeum sp.]|uniref:Uncharacterized protein n=1 Tax=Caldiarchaeum subterraneum TaxID=311458 RepID=A0A7C5Q8X0_CALS0